MNEKTEYLNIVSITRNDGKTYKIKDNVTLMDNIYQGVIDGFNKFTDGIRVHIINDQNRKYFSIDDLD